MNRILLVEDDERLQQLYQSVLERAGFLVFAVANGTEALKQIREYSSGCDHHRYYDA